MKRTTLLFLSSLIFLFSQLVYAEESSNVAVNSSPANISELDHIVAVINKEAITSVELNKRMENVLTRLRKKNVKLPPENVVRRQILEQLIVEKIQLQLAKRRGIKITDQTLNRVVANIAQKNNMDLATFREALQRDGLNYKEFRDNIRNEMLITRLRQRSVESRIHVSDQEVELHLANLKNQAPLNAEFRLGHILLAVPENATPEQIAFIKSKANSVHAKLNNGADFTQMAIAESSGQNALSGGDLGWRKAGQLPTLFADMITDMKVGNITQPIRSPSGFHIVKLLDRRSKEQRHLVQQTRARHILIQPSPLQSNAEVRQLLETLLSRIENGEDFATLAKANSTDKGTADKGGDLGWVNPGQTVPRFEAAMNKLKAGEISQPFQSKFGWHILQVLERRNHDSTDDYRKLMAFKEIKQRKTEEATENWLRRIRDESYVDYRLNK